MSTNNCNNKEDYSMDDLATAMGKLGDGGWRNTNDVSDEELFKQPPPKEDCPICLLCLPTFGSGSIHYACCGKMICSGCGNAPVKDKMDTSSHL